MNTTRKSQHQKNGCHFDPDGGRGDPPAGRAGIPRERTTAQDISRRSASLEITTNPNPKHATNNKTMKKIILSTFAFFLFTFALSVDRQAFSQNYGWKDISANLPELGGFNDVHVIGDEIWITGGNAEVFYSPDGGETFQIQQLPANSGITSSIFMKNNQEGYVVTFLGNILKTDNGGTTWTTLYEPGGALNSVHFPPNSDTGYACGTNGTVYMFDDSSITDISPSGVSSNLQSICFPVDNNDGKVCGETTVIRHINNTWSNWQYYDNNYFYNSIFFIDDTTGWAVGINGKIIRTIDGIHWNGQISNATTTLNDVFFINSLVGWAAGTEILLHTVDGGVTWTEELESFTPEKELRAIYFTSAHNGYVVGNDVVLKYGEISGIGDGVQTLQFDIFPNPAKNKVEFRSSEFATKNCSLKICDLNGKTLIEKHIPSGTETVEIDVSNLANGVYFCTLKTNKGNATKKLIIQK